MVKRVWKRSNELNDFSTCTVALGLFPFEKICVLVECLIKTETFLDGSYSKHEAASMLWSTVIVL